LGFVHRDIKPENLLVDQWNRVKLLDFGLARIEGVRSITQAGTVVGSLYYVSPEQLLGQKVDGRTDVYALGVSMYEMLTGQRPYVGQTLTEMSDAILAAVAVAPSQIEPSVPPELERIIARAMARGLEQRYHSAGELYTDLRALQAALTASTQFQPPQRTQPQTAPTPPATAERGTPSTVYGVPPPRRGATPARPPRATLRPMSLEPVPAEQRDNHLAYQPPPRDPRT
ncbi:MAG: protein kinase, partial [Ktedonobacterales bacterium]|nr:protein kinase [Ktedonobacterales bacterium]